jgi:transcriptional regulator GlxA family with amidase domain
MEVAEQLMHYRMRESHERQRLKTRERLAMADPRLVAAVELMESELEEPLSLAEIARRAAISRRQLERLFAGFFSKSPLEYYRNLRLHKSRRLLVQTAMSVLEIAIACGFRSSSHFTQQYRAFFGRTPSEDRKRRSQFTIFSPPSEAPTPRRRPPSAGASPD